MAANPRKDIQQKLDAFSRNRTTHVQQRNVRAPLIEGILIGKKNSLYPQGDDPKTIGRKAMLASERLPRGCTVTNDQRGLLQTGQNTAGHFSKPPRPDLRCLASQRAK